MIPSTIRLAAIAQARTPLIKFLGPRSALHEGNREQADSCVLVPKGVGTGWRIKDRQRTIGTIKEQGPCWDYFFYRGEYRIPTTYSHKE